MVLQRCMVKYDSISNIYVCVTDFSILHLPYMRRRILKCVPHYRHIYLKCIVNVCCTSAFLIAIDDYLYVFKSKCKLNDTKCR